MGDTRYDQVLRRSRESMRVQLLAPEVIAGKKVIIAGSTWPEDEAVLLPACRELMVERNDVLVILVPHEPTPNALEQLEQSLATHSHIRFSALSGYQGESYILVDSIGILMSLYRYGHVAFVGGSFHQGIHNVLEPAVYGIPVLIGPVHENSQEATALIAAGAAILVHDWEEICGLSGNFRQRSEENCDRSACSPVRYGACGRDRFFCRAARQGIIRKVNHEDSIFRYDCRGERAI